MKNYIAYGSNLNKEQMRFRCPEAKALGKGTLKGWRLLFKGSGTGAYLTIERHKGGKVPFGIWSISEEDERHLDRYEGFPTFYYKKELPVTYTEDSTGREIGTTALVYIMHEDREIGIPSRRYMEVCRKGYSDFGLDEVFLANAYDRSWRMFV